MLIALDPCPARQRHLTRKRNSTQKTHEEVLHDQRISASGVPFVRRKPSLPRVVKSVRRLILFPSSLCSLNCLRNGINATTSLPAHSEVFEIARERIPVYCWCRPHSNLQANRSKSLRQNGFNIAFFNNNNGKQNKNSWVNDRGHNFKVVLCLLYYNAHTARYQHVVKRNVVRSVMPFNIGSLPVQNFVKVATITELLDCEHGHC